MNGVELTTPELAYLLAALDCSEILGLEDPALFPSSPSVMGKTYKKGRNSLEENGWLKPVKGRSEEYELDALLLEAVSVLAAPENMVASTYTADGGSSELVLHFLAADNIVELTAPEKKVYWLSMLESRDAIFEQIALLMQLDKPNVHAETEIDQKLLEKVKGFIDKGKPEQALKALESSNLDNDQIQSFLAGLESGARSSLVVVSIQNGEITSGRRFYVYGSGGTAWMTFTPSPSSSNVITRPCSDEAIGDFINSFLE